MPAPSRAPPTKRALPRLCAPRPARSRRGLRCPSPTPTDLRLPSRRCSFWPEGARRCRPSSGPSRRRALPPALGGGGERAEGATAKSGGGRAGEEADDPRRRPAELFLSLPLSARARRGARRPQPPVFAAPVRLPLAYLFPPPRSVPSTRDARRSTSGLAAFMASRLLPTRAPAHTSARPAAFPLRPICRLFPHAPLLPPVRSASRHVSLDVVRRTVRARRPPRGQRPAAAGAAGLGLGDVPGARHPTFRARLALSRVAGRRKTAQKGQKPDHSSQSP